MSILWCLVFYCIYFRLLEKKPIVTEAIDVFDDFVVFPPEKGNSPDNYDSNSKAGKMFR